MTEGTYADSEVENHFQRQRGSKKNMIVTGFSGGAAIYATPSSIMRPSVARDGNMFCALSGEDLMVGVCGFGKTPMLALADYDRNFVHKAAPERELKPFTEWDT